MIRYFYELSVKDSKYHASPVNSFKIGDSGISNYDCAVIHPGNKMQFRKTSCFCNKSIASDFRENCNHTEYCGKWIPTKASKYPKHSEAVHTPKKKTNNERIPNNTRKPNNKRKSTNKRKPNNNRKRQSQPSELQPRNKKRRVHILVVARHKNSLNLPHDLPNLE